MEVLHIRCVKSKTALHFVSNLGERHIELDVQPDDVVPMPRPNFVKDLGASAPVLILSTCHGLGTIPTQ